LEKWVKWKGETAIAAGSGIDWAAVKDVILSSDRIIHASTRTLSPRTTDLQQGGTIPERGGGVVGGPKASGSFVFGLREVRTKQYL